MKLKLSDKKIYLVALLSLAGIIVVNQIIIQYLIREIKDDAVVINTAGKQRMLSQRIVKNIYLSFDSPEYLQIAKSDAEQWNMAHIGLQEGDSSMGLPPNESKVIQRQFDVLSGYQSTIYDLVSNAETPDELYLKRSEIALAEQEFLTLMDAIVNQFEVESNARVSRLIMIEILLGIISIMILVFEFRFIFNPLIKKIKLNALKLEKINLSKDRILATVAHDMRSPLTGILGTINLMNTQLTDLDDSYKQMLEYAEKSSIKLEKMIDELLEISKLESEDYILKKELTSVRSLFDQIRQPLEERALEKEIDFEIDIRTTGLSVDIDMHSFQRVLDNLVNNAIKFTNRNGKISLKSFESESKIIFEVSDTGIGIPTDLQDQIFDRYTLARRTGTEGEETIGLGMSIVKGIVEKHNGDIWFESEEGKGTSFYISLPKAA